METLFGLSIGLTFERHLHPSASLSPGLSFPFYSQLLLKTKVAKAVASTGPRKGQTLKALLGFHSSKADGMLYGMSPAEGCFFRWKMVRKCCRTSQLGPAVSFTSLLPPISRRGCKAASICVPLLCMVHFPGDFRSLSNAAIAARAHQQIPCADSEI